MATTAYITWLSTDQPIRMNAAHPAGPNAVPQLKLAVAQADAKRGATLFADRCATCHGKDGQGEDDNPPVWGARSFNEGAGLANVVQLASWLKVAMPLDDTNLTNQQALDVAAFVNSHDRPKFRLAEHLPAKTDLGAYNSESDR